MDSVQYRFIFYNLIYLVMDIVVIIEIDYFSGYIYGYVNEGRVKVDFGGGSIQQVFCYIKVYLNG